jgi:archaetidylinositol phosphate synthase
LGFTPNHISIIGVILGLFSGLSFYLAGQTDKLNASDTYLFYAVLLLLSSGFCDALDGALARFTGKISREGGFLDSLLDRYVEVSVFFGIIVGELCETSWGFLALTGSLLTSYIRARSEAAGYPMETIGVFERAERILLIVVASILGIFWRNFLSLSIIFLALMTNLTVAQRALYFIRHKHEK